MGYQALVFCPEEKTARTVTQVLTELEFSVETCTEPFAAVKKLMGQHFDAIVVDCDNEQNATLLFKSARNSSSNQTSLAVAIVEGQAGVAKAFRIGANLVLTKPINIEQAKGTVRVARGLLRKSEPAKAASPAPSSPVAAPAKPAPPKLVVAARPPAPAAPKPVSKPLVAEIPAPKPAAPAAWPASPASVSAPAASSEPIAKDIAPLEIDLEEPTLPAALSLLPPTTPQAHKLPEPSAPATPAFAAAIPVAPGGAASAPAPARIPEVPEKSHVTTPAHAGVKAAEPAQSEAPQSQPTGVVGFTPSFDFGDAGADAASSGGSKKIIIGVAAAVLIGAVAYFGWTQFQEHSNQSTPTQAGVAAPVARSQPAKSTSNQTPFAATAAAAPAQQITLSNTPTNSDAESSLKEGASKEGLSKESSAHAVGISAKSASATAPAKAEEKTEAETTPLVVKPGKGLGAKARSAAAETAAPSLIGLASPGATVPPPNFLPAASNGFKPTLQTINISQGVSQGLLIKKVSPNYPSNALRMRIEGAVQLLATVSKDGNISQVKILSGDAQLTRAAADAVKLWKYKPYLLNGEPVDIQTQVTINFRLPN
jgi:TonB family protein